jgi:acetyltransferase-like isoleucine patch superfamily enzyme
MGSLSQRLKSNKWLMNLLYQFRFHWRGNKAFLSGKQNYIQTVQAMVCDNVFDIKGSNNNVVIEPGASVKNCKIVILGNNHTLHIGKDVVLTESLIWFEDEGCTIKFGDRTTMQRHGHVAVTEPNRSIIIGEDCMFSFDVDIRNGDSHAIFEAATGKRINYAKDVHIGNRVWLGAYSQVLGGANIGENAIIGIRSLISKPFPAGCIGAGIPAKVVREGVTWNSQRTYDDNYDSFLNSLS